MERLAPFVLSVIVWVLAYPPPTHAAGPEAAAFDYSSYGEVLKAHVNEYGMVNYRGLMAKREKLEAFITALGRLEPARYQAWSDDQKIALWINAYNALVLRIIIDHYPIKPSLFKLAVFPRHSIWHISGVWDNLKYPVMGRPMSLNDIEHANLRKDFREPRIHVALVCASLGCPPLRNEPFTARQLDAQLEGQARRFLSNKHNFRIDRTLKRVYISSIFKWFGEDFLETYGTDNTFDGHTKKVRGVLNFVSKHVPPEVEKYLATQAYSIQYTDYDWSLNEQKEG